MSSTSNLSSGIKSFCDAIKVITQDSNWREMMIQTNLKKLQSIKNKMGRTQRWVDEATATNMKHLNGELEDEDQEILLSCVVDDFERYISSAADLTSVWVPSGQFVVDDLKVVDTPVSQRHPNVGAVEATIGPEGGEVCIGKSVVASFPPGAIQHATNIKLEIVDNESMPSTEGFVDITPTIECLPHGLTFPKDKPVTIKLATWVSKSAHQKTLRGVVFDENLPQNTFEQTEIVKIANDTMIAFKCFHFSRKKVSMRNNKPANIRLQYFLTCDEHDNFKTVFVVAEEYHIVRILDKFRHCKLLCPPGRTLNIPTKKRILVKLTVRSPNRFKFSPRKESKITVDSKFLKSKCDSCNFVLLCKKDGPGQVMYSYIVNDHEQTMALKWPLIFNIDAKTENRHFVENLSTFAYGDGTKLRVQNSTVNVTSTPTPSSKELPNEKDDMATHEKDPGTFEKNTPTQNREVKNKKSKKRKRKKSKNRRMTNGAPGISRVFNLADQTFFRRVISLFLIATVYILMQHFVMDAAE